jgi:hypothetical protein
MNVTPGKAAVAICQGYDLAIVRDEKTGDLEIEPAEYKKRHHLRLK